MALIDNLAAYWSLDEASGTRADSFSTNDLTDNNTVGSAAGKQANAGDFEVDNSEYLSRASNTELQTGDIDFTICGWVYLESKGTDRVIVSKLDTSNYEYKIEYASSGDRFQFFCANNTTIIGTAVANTLGSPSTGTWYFIVAWHDAAANTVNIQVNNGTVDSVGTTGSPNTGSAEFRIGAQAFTGFPQHWDGLIDELGLWKRVLTSDERTELFNSGAGRDYAYISDRAAADYYIDAVAGDDGNTGLVGDPWQTSAAANSFKFVAGDTLNLNRGDEFDPLLIQLATGGTEPTALLPIIIRPYGSGAAPIVNAGTTDYGIRVLNLPHTIVEDIEVFGATVTLTPGSPNTVSYTNTGYGIQFQNTTSANLEGCIVRRCEVHGVARPIVFGDDAASQTHGYTDFEASNNTLHDSTITGLACTNYLDYSATIHLNGVFSDNYIYNIHGNYNGTTGDNTGYGLVTLSCTGMLVERNTIKDCGRASDPGEAGGPVGVMCKGAIGTIIRGNVVVNQTSQTADGGGLHLDGTVCEDCIIERNYVVGCREGIVVLNIGAGTVDNIIRYNVVQDAETYALYIHSGTGTILHNNTVYQSAGECIRTVNNTAQFYNNIFISAGSSTIGTVITGTVLNGNLYDCVSFSLTYDGNTRTSLAALQSGDSQEADGVEASAGLEDAGNGPATWTDPDVYASSITDYDVQPGSAARNAGVDLLATYTIDPGDADFHYLADGSWDGFNIGADESVATGNRRRRVLICGRA